MAAAALIAIDFRPSPTGALVDIEHPGVADEFAVAPRAARTTFRPTGLIDDEGEIALDRLEHRSCNAGRAAGPRHRHRVEQHLEARYRRARSALRSQRRMQFAKSARYVRTQPHNSAPRPG